MAPTQKTSTLIAAGLLLLAGDGLAFTVMTPNGSRLSTFSTTTQLHGITKRGKLAKTLEGTPSKTRRSKPSAARKKAAPTGKAGDKDVAIAPGLAAWMAQQPDDADGSQGAAATLTPAMEQPAEVDDSDAASFQPFEDDDAKTKKGKGKKGSRRVKQSERKVLEEQRKVNVDAAVKKLLKTLKENNNLDATLAAIRSILSIESSNLRQVVASAKKLDYRLAWVGGDDAVCHVGTGLHKVPLARLQEVFLSSLGRSRIELLEVIRILGPFPNVKNILQGNSKVGSLNDPFNRDVNSWQITMDSMVDGTGKEILAGSDDNIRRVLLHVYFADENAIIACVPGEDDEVRDDPLDESGANLLVFVREDSLDEKLEALRVL